MKKVNLIKRLLSDSHEKQSPQRFARYAAMLILLLTLGVGQMWATTVYYVNRNSWSGVKIHYWGGSSGSDWDSRPSMTKLSYKVNGFDVYSYDIGNNNKLIFMNKDNSEQRDGGDVSFSDSSKPYYFGGWYASWAECWQVKDSHDSWAGTTCTSTGNNTGRATISLSADIEFKLYCLSDGVWYGSDGGTIPDNTSWTFNGSTNTGLDVTHTGNYIFDIDFSGSKPSVKTHAPYQVSYAKGTGATGTVSASAVTTYGSTCMLSSSTFSKTGYTQDGWATSDGGSKVYELGGTYTGGYVDVTLYPHWTAKTYDVTLSPDNGGSTKTVVATYNAAMPSKYKDNSSIAAPTYSGYAFQGYYDDHAGAGTQYYTSTPASAHKWDKASTATLYAKWTQTVKLDKNTEAAGATDGSVDVVYNKSGNSNFSGATRPGYDCDGYYTASSSGYKVIAADGTMQSTSSNISSFIGTSDKWVHVGASTLYAYWTAKDYTITLNCNGATSTTGVPASVTARFDATAPDSDGGDNYRFADITANPSKTGYTFAGWWTSSDGGTTLVTEIITKYKYYNFGTTYVDATGHWIYPNNLTIYAKWTPNEYTITLTQEGETGYGSAGANSSVEATYDAALPNMGSAPTGAAGYQFQGYFTGKNGTGTQYYGADGSKIVGSYTTADNLELFAYFQKTVISTLEHPATVAKGHEVTVDVNPVFNQDGASDYMDICWSLLYDNDNPVESGVAIAANPVGGKLNQVRFTLTDLSSGYYKIKAVLKASASSSFSPCSAGSELSTIKSDLRIAGNSTVTIQYEDASGNKIAANSSVEVARGDSIGIKAPNIIGYSFTGWTLGDVISNTCRDGGSCGTGKDSINIKADYDGYLTASYAKKQMIYFNNTLEWDTVYVYFYNNGTYWGNKNQGTGANTSDFSGAYTGKHGGMTKIAGTNIYYFDLAANSVSTSLTNVAFTEKDQHGYGFFSANNVIGRGDYIGTLPMYVPLAGVDPVTKNGDGEYKSYYYEKGYWLNYPESTGYTLKIYDNTGAGALVKERDFPFSADKAMPMSVTVDLEGGNKTYGFKIYRAGDTWFRNGGTMTNGHSGDEGQAAWVFGTESGTNCGLTTTSAGNYTFKVWVNSDGNHQVGVHYPESTGDFRVMYIDDDRITKHGGVGNEGKSWLLSSVIPGNTESDTISYFVRAEGSKNPKYKIQKCSVTDDPLHPGEEQYRTVGWADQGEEIEVPDSIDENGVYNFIFAKDNGSLVLQKIEPYEGNFYIRVDGAGSSNWDNFRASDHLMPYSDYSFSQATDKYSHYFTQWYKVVKEGGDVKVKNIKFVVANDYSVCVSDTIVKDGKADAYVDANGYITRSANIRFMYNYKTNEATRRYVDGAQENDSQFLMILSDDSKMFAASSGGSALTELRFSDKGNWIYEAEVYALPTATYKLRSKFGEDPKSDDGDWERKGVITQYFKGSPSSTETLIGGDEESETRVKIRLLYDFKTNRVVAAYQPSSGTIASDMAINADIMFMREHQGDIEQITFSGDAKITDIKNIYCCLKFNKYTLNNKSTEVGHATLSPLLSRYERDIFYVSFPYDVRVSDVIGFGTYGQHWIIEYYNGAERAEKGFWADSESFWHFVTPAMKDTFTLKAGTGYIVALDLDELYWIDNTHYSSIWNNTDEVELLFPGDVSTISDREVTYNMPVHQCTINRGTTYGNRTKKDSHWNVLGVPTFKNITGAASEAVPEDGGGSGAIRFSNTAVLDTLVNDLKFIYDGNLSDNSLTAKAVKGFEFKAMHAYVVQYCGDVTFTTSATPAPSPIVARRTYAEKPRDIDFRLELNKNGVMEDQTFVSLSNDENVSAGFAFGEDLSKEFNSNRANIYTFIGTEWVAGNTLPMSEQTTVIPVGVKIAADGDYTFAIPEGTEGVGVTLVDNETGVRTSLSALDYTISLSAGTYDERFVLEISPVRPISTDLEAVTGDGLQVTGARKIMIDGILYIVKDGKMFDARGNRVN